MSRLATTNFTSQSEAIKLFAADLVSQSVYINTSAFPLKLFYARANRTEAVDALEIKFPKWARAKGVRIDPDKYSDFLRNLPKRVMSKMPLILGTAFRPCDVGHFIDHVGAPLANTFVPFNPAPTVQPDLAILEEYFDRIFENEEDRKTTLQFLAHIIQQPMVRPQWGLLVTGKAGCGKSSLYSLLRLAMGGKHVYSDNQYSPPFARFSETLPNNVLVCFDDATASKGTYEDLKLAVTRTIMPVETKHAQGYVEREVYARIAVISNNVRPFTFPSDCRRFYVLEYMTHVSKHNPDGCELNTAEFFERFIKWINDADTPAILYHYFKTIDLSDFKSGSCVKTANHKLLAGLSLSVVDSLIDNFFEDYGTAYRFHPDELLSYLKSNGAEHPNLDSLKLKLAAIGYEHKRRDIKDAKGKLRKHPVWQPISTRSPSFTPEEETRIKESSGTASF